MENFLYETYGIRIYYNVLDEEERIGLLNESKKHLKNLGPRWPGLQTNPNLHLHLMNVKPLETFLCLSGFNSIEKCWVNYTDDSMKYISWHNHSKSRFTSIYYLDNPEGRGTMFDVDGKKFQLDVPTNTLMCIPPDIIHSVPENVTQPRYSLVIDS
jgi:hypothetical protein